MKKLLVVLALVLLGSVSYAQWSGGTGNQYLMTSGNVGIGITAPVADVSVYDPTGVAAILLDCGTTGNTTKGQYTMQANGGLDFYRNVLRKNALGQYEMLQTLQSSAPGVGAMAFLYVNTTTKKFEMRSGIADVEFQNTGTYSFGMGGLAVPAGAKMAIGGKVVCKEIEVTLTGLPDFVFSSDYKLRSLYDVENFINSNKHLPDVPSAREVTEKGLNLGNMNATLLQKVEELTLYMIQLQKENDALKTRVSNLEK
jgi:hypothetical protein